MRELPKGVLKMASGLISPSGLAGHRRQLCNIIQYLLLLLQDKKKAKAKKNEAELKPVKEVPIAENEEGSKNETGCVIS